MQGKSDELSPAKWTPSKLSSLSFSQRAPRTPEKSHPRISMRHSNMDDYASSRHPEENSFRRQVIHRGTGVFSQHLEPHNQIYQSDRSLQISCPEPSNEQSPQKNPTVER